MDGERGTGPTVSAGWEVVSCSRERHCTLTLPLKRTNRLVTSNLMPVCTLCFCLNQENSYSRHSVWRYWGNFQVVQKGLPKKGIKIYTYIICALRFFSFYCSPFVSEWPVFPLFLWLPIANTAVKRRACARESILEGRAPISRAKFQRKTLQATAVSQNVRKKWKRS